MSFEELIEEAVARGVARALEQTKGVGADSELLRVGAAAKLAHVSPATIRAWIAGGSLKRYGSSRVVLVRREELLAITPKPSEKRTVKDMAEELMGKRG